MPKESLFFILILLSVGVVFIFGVSQGTFQHATLTDTKEITLSADEINSNTPTLTKTAQPEEETESCLLGINEVSKATLTKIPGIGDVLSQRIIDAPPIKNKKDLIQVEGIGEITAEKIEEFICNKTLQEKRQVEKKNNEEERNNEKNSQKKTFDEKDIAKLINFALEKKNQRPDSREDDLQKSGKIDINTADVKTLQKITGLGPVYSKRIIDNRPFNSLDNLIEIDGIGEKTVENIKEQGLATVLNAQAVNHNKNPEKKKEEKDNEGSENNDDELKKEIRKLENELEDMEDKYSKVKNNLHKKNKTINKKEKTIEDLLLQRDACHLKEQININSADKDELLEISGIGEEKAEMIISFRKEKQLPHLDKLKKLDGIGKKTVVLLRENGFCAEITEKSTNENKKASESTSQDEEEKEEEKAENNKDKIEINSASSTTLQKITGVGETIAQNIIKKRPFCKITDLTKVSGIGEKTLNSIKEQNLAWVNINEIDIFNCIKIKKEDPIYFENSNTTTTELVIKNQTDEKLCIKINNNQLEFEPKEEKIRTITFRDITDNEKKEIDLEIKKQIKVLTFNFEKTQAKNLIVNWHFDKWENENKPSGWKGSHSFATNWFKAEKSLVGDYAVRIDGGGQRDLDQRKKGLLEENTKYYLELWAKGEGTIEIAIIRPSGYFNYIEKPILLKGEKWTKIIHQDKGASGDSKSGIRIRTNGKDGNIYIGAVWLGKEKPPENWLENH